MKGYASVLHETRSTSLLIYQKENNHSHINDHTHFHLAPQRRTSSTHIHIHNECAKEVFPEWKTCVDDLMFTGHLCMMEGLSSVPPNIARVSLVCWLEG